MTQAAIAAGAAAVNPVAGVIAAAIIAGGSGGGAISSATNPPATIMPPLPKPGLFPNVTANPWANSVMAAGGMAITGPWASTNAGPGTMGRLGINRNPLVQTSAGPRRRFRVAAGWLQSAPPGYIVGAHNPDGSTTLIAVPAGGFARVRKGNISYY